MHPNWNFIYYVAKQAKWEIEGLEEKYPERTPIRSNVDDLERILEELIARVPPSWRHHIENLFVGRVLAGSVNAKAWSEEQAGIVEINIQFTLILGSYFAAYDEYLLALKGYALGPPSDAAEMDAALAVLNDRLRLPWDRLEERRHHWTNPRILEHGLIDTPFPVSDESQRYRKALMTAGEMFIVAHEVSHHLLGHTRKNKKRQPAVGLTHRLITDSGLRGVLPTLNRLQWDEIQVDVLAFMMVADAIDKRTSVAKVDIALEACTIVLMCLAHVGQAWVDDDTFETHPCLNTRFKALQHIARHVTVEIAPEPDFSHPAYKIVLLGIFVGVAIHHTDGQKGGRNSQLGIAAVSKLVDIHLDHLKRSLQERPNEWTYPEPES
jgi:hypothetical protein